GQSRVALGTTAGHRSDTKAAGKNSLCQNGPTMADNPLDTAGGSRANDEVCDPRPGGDRPRVDRGPPLPPVVVLVLGFRHGRVLRHREGPPSDPARLDDLLRLGRDLSVLPGHVLLAGGPRGSRRPRPPDR